MQSLTIFVPSKTYCCWAVFRITSCLGDKKGVFIIEEGGTINLKLLLKGMEQFDISKVMI